MEVFYCKECEEWFSYDDGVYYPVAEEATRYEVEKFSKSEHCVKCGAPVEVSTIVDDVVEFMNKKGVKLDDIKGLRSKGINNKSLPIMIDEPEGVIIQLTLNEKTFLSMTISLEDFEKLKTNPRYKVNKDNTVEEVKYNV